MLGFTKLLTAALVFVVCAMPQWASAQSAPPTEWRETEYMAFDSYTEVFGDSLDEVCRKANQFGSAAIYYKGALFIRYILRPDHSVAVADCASGEIQLAPAYLVCTTYHFVDGVKTRKSRTYNVWNCEKPIDQCALEVGNPVDIADFTKLVRAEDWSSPIDPRFKIERSYRSDAAFSARFGGATTSQYDLFANIWQRTYSDTVYTSSSNPYDPSDTRTWYRYETGEGKVIYILSSDLSQTLGGSDGYTITSGPNRLYITDPQGVKKSFYLNNFPFVLTSVAWPDGYEILMDRGTTTYKDPVGMTDNKGNRAVYVFNQNVVPGANRKLISEIIFSRKSGATYVETGRLVYGYATLTYAAIGANGNADPTVARTAKPKYPVIASVDYRLAGSSTNVPVWRYTYATELPSEPANPDGSLNPVQFSPVVGPLLTSISDGGTTPYAEYTYRYYGTDAAGNYMGFGVATEKYAGDAQPTAFTRNSAGDVHTMTNPKGLSTSYTFAQVGRNKKVVAVTGAPAPGCLGTNLATTYNASEKTTETINRNGSKTTYVRDAKQRVLTKVEDADGLAPRTTTYTWHATLSLPLTRVTDGLTETFTYDTAGHLLTYSKTDTKVGSPTNGQVRTWTYGYTTLASTLKVLTTLNGPGLTADGITDVSTYTYTATGDLATATDPNGLVTTILARNGNGQPTLVEEADKSQWAFAYDHEGRVLSASFAGPGQTPLVSTFDYNASGQVASYTNSRGKTWTFAYNAARRLTGSTSPTGDAVAYTYDAAGNVIREEYRNGTGPVTFWEETQFDGLNRVLTTFGAMGQQWAFAHDQEDNLTSVTDPLTHSTTNGFDALNRLVTVVDRESFTAGMEYNPADQLTEYTDPRAIETDFTYNGFGEVVTEASADRGTIAFTYDRRGLVKTRTDGRGITTTYAYDNGGRLTLIDYPAATIPDIAFTYDTPFLGVPANSNKGHTARINDTVIDTQFGHEVTATGPRVTATATYPGGRSYTVVEETDFEGNPTRTVYPSGREILFDSDDDNRISRIRLKDGVTLTSLMDQITYAPNGPMLSALYGDGYTQTRTYDLSYRLTGLKDALGTTTLRDVTMGYEGRDNLASITDALTSSNSETFTYTPRESLSGATGPYGALAYTYDGVGNRITAALGAESDGYIYPLASNQLTLINLATGGTRGYTYDAAGNVTAEARPGGTYGYTYNAAGRMSEFTINGFLQASYQYDAMGRQAIRTLTSPTAVTIHSVFDSQGRRIAEYDQTSGALIREYVWNNWDPIAVIEGGVVSFVRADHIGRPVFATDATGTKVWSATYTPFGGVHTSTGVLPTARFPGQWFQTESGLHQNWMRDYDPTTGRYIQADPLGLVDGASVYGYVKQNPGRWIDPRGEFIPIPIAVGLAIGLLLDFAIEKAAQYCQCDEADRGYLPDNKYTAVGGAYGGTGPFATKNRTGISGGGPSGSRTSVVSQASPRANGHYGRTWGRRVGRYVPYAAAAFALYDGYRLWKCATR